MKHPCEGCGHEGSRMEGVVMQYGRDLGCRVWSSVWEGSGMEGVAMQCGRSLRWRVWPCSVGGVWDGECGHAVWDRGEGVTVQCACERGQRWRK